MDFLQDFLFTNDFFFNLEIWMKLKPPNPTPALEIKWNVFQYYFLFIESSG